MSGTVCIKPPLVRQLGRVAIIGAVGPTLWSGPTAALLNPSPTAEDQRRQEVRRANAHVRSAAAAAEQALSRADSMSLQDLAEAKKTAQRTLNGEKGRAAPQLLRQLDEAFKTLQRKESKRREDTAARASPASTSDSRPWNEGHPDVDPPPRTGATDTSNAHKPTTIDKVLAARAVRLDSRALLARALENPKIPVEMRNELPAAMDKVQDVSPHAPGIALGHVDGLELGRASQRGSGGTLLVSTLDSRGHAHGFAYEVIAAARFIVEPRSPGNGGQPVQIVKGQDELIFGQKLPAGPKRKTVEADTLIVKPGGHKIAIDSKAYSAPFGDRRELRSELEGIKEAIRQGEVHEFHFAVRDKISSNAKKLIEEFDKDLRNELSSSPRSDDLTISQWQAQDLDLSRPLICWHENLG